MRRISTTLVWAFSMKCQNCAKKANLHITEVLAEGMCEEFHLCEDCAKKHLYEPQITKTKQDEVSEETDNVNERHCETCGIKFVEFRNTGRLGCPHDYEAFRTELLPLLESIHGHTRHTGKTPRTLPRTKQTLNELNRLRKQLNQAVLEEAYEEAARLRDRIRQLEEI